MSLELTARGVPSGRLRRAVNITLVIAMLMLGVALVGTAQANADCGSVITQSIRLTHDIGPCPGDGLIIRADNITVDLGGHRVFAAVPNGAPENAGIRLAQVSGVTVQNGTVEGFDAGVFINGGSNNVIQRINALNNINDMTEPFTFVPGAAIFCPPSNPSCGADTPDPDDDIRRQPQIESGEVSPQRYFAEMLCLFGDGITTESSDNNLIRNNRVIGNGPYGGITLVGDSDSNRVEKNQVDANNINNFTTRADGSQGSGMCGATLPGAPGMQRGREVQAMGIRIEGPGANENVIDGNQVTESALVGISIHSWVCMPLPGEPRPGAPNDQNLITKNRVSDTGAERRRTATGFEETEQDAFADGISSLAQGPIGTVTCTSPNNTIVNNNSMDNDRHGISLHRTVEETEVSRNVANKNGDSGIWVAETAVNNTLHANRAHQNSVFDGADLNPDCDANSWLRNRFLTVNQPCVAAAGTGWVNGPGNSGQAPGQQDDRPNATRGPRN